MIDEKILISNGFDKIGDSYRIYFFKIGVYILYDISGTLFIQKKILGSTSKYTIKSISEDRLIKNVNAYRFISDSVLSFKVNSGRLSLNLIANDLRNSPTINVGTTNRYT